MSKQTHIIGREAIRIAAIYDEKKNVPITLSKFTDPTDDARDGVDLAEAYVIAREDASLVYLPAAKKTALDCVEAAPWDEYGSHLSGYKIWPRGVMSESDRQSNYTYAMAVAIVDRRY